MLIPTTVNQAWKDFVHKSRIQKSEQVAYWSWEGLSLEKLCTCGEAMEVRLRTVIFAKHVTIENVPIYTCEQCSRSEVISDVKPELSALLGQLGSAPGKQLLYFNESNELALLLYEAAKKERSHEPVESIVKERINQLLDLLLLANSLEDTHWIHELHERLSQLTKVGTHTYGLKS